MLKELEKVLYCEVYTVTDPGKTELRSSRGQLLTEDEYYELARPSMATSAFTAAHGRRGGS